MYRIVCESYENYKKDFLPDNEDDYRFSVTKPLELVVDIPLYESEKKMAPYSIKSWKTLYFVKAGYSQTS